MFKKTITWGTDTTAVGGGTDNFTTVAGSSGTLQHGASFVNFQMNGLASGVQNFASFGYAFNISNSPDYQQLLTQFDYWRLRKVVLRLIPFGTVSNTDSVAASGYSNSNCFLHTWIDPNTSVPPTASEVGIATGQGYQSYRMQRMVGRGFYRSIKPKLQVPLEILGGGSITGGQSSRGQWVSSNSATMPIYFGLRGVVEGIQPTSNASIIQMRAEITYYVEFKTPR